MVPTSCRAAGGAFEWWMDDDLSRPIEPEAEMESMKCRAGHFGGQVVCCRWQGGLDHLAPQPWLIRPWLSGNERDGRRCKELRQVCIRSLGHGTEMGPVVPNSPKNCCRGDLKTEWFAPRTRIIGYPSRIPSRNDVPIPSCLSDPGLYKFNAFALCNASALRIRRRSI